MPRYDARVAAAALDVEYRWLDTTLPRLDLDGVAGGGRGRRRTLTDQSILLLLVARELTESLGLPLERAVGLARRLLEDPAGSIDAGPVHLTVDLPRCQALLRERLASAVELAVPIRRGRPPRR